MLGKNADNCLYLCRKENDMDLQCQRMQCKMLWQKVTEILPGRGGPYQTAVLCTAQSRVQMGKMKCMEREMLSRSSWHPGSASPRRLFHSSQLHPRAPTGPSPCVHAYVTRDVFVQVEKLVEKAGRSVKQTQEDDCFILNSPTWSLPEGRCIFRYIFTFSNTLWQSLWRDYNVQTNRNKIAAGESREQTSFPPPLVRA